MHVKIIFARTIPMRICGYRNKGGECISFLTGSFCRQNAGENTLKLELKVERDEIVLRVKTLVPQKAWPHCDTLANTWQKNISSRLTPVFRPPRELILKLYQRCLSCNTQSATVYSSLPYRYLVLRKFLISVHLSQRE